MMKKRLFIIVVVLIILAIIGIFYKTKLSKNNNNIITNNVSDFKENIVAINTDENFQNEVIEENSNQTNDLFSEFYDEAEEILSKMTLEEKVGQMFLVRFPSSGVISEIEDYSPAGYILFGKDFEDETKNSIKQKLQNCQNASKIPLALGVDEEGGTVVRVSMYKSFRESPFKSPREVYASGGMNSIISDSHEKNALLKSIGINMNLTPVVDIPEDSNDFIYDRAFSTDVEKVKDFTNKIINTMKSDNITSVMKHFPGYGNNVDTHTGIAVDKRSYSNFENRDFIPFKEGIKEGAPAILVSHNIVECMDASMPASLSSNVHNVLREKLEFTGLIITDDLAMDAVKEYVENGNAATQAVLAGNDLIISSDFVNQKSEVMESIKKGDISEDIIDTAVRRVLAWKICYGIIE